MIFCKTKKICIHLQNLHSRESISRCDEGDIEQRDRDKAMRKFKVKVGLLVTTDIAARGIDVPEV